MIRFNYRGSRIAKARWIEQWLKLRQRPVQRVAMWVLSIFVLSALMADMLASSQPLVLYFRGHLYLFPNRFHPAKLRIYDNELLLRYLNPRDWAVLPIIPWGYNGHDLTHILSAPGAVHWLGTDSSGRDVLARLLHGARVSLMVGILSVCVLVTIGVTLGTLAGYFGGLLDIVLMRLLEIVHSIPTILLLVTLLSVLAPEGYGAVIAMTVVIGFVWWTDVARLNSRRDFAGKRVRLCAGGSGARRQHGTCNFYSRAAQCIKSSLC